MNVRRHGGRRYRCVRENTLGKTDFYVQNFLNLMPLGVRPLPNVVFANIPFGSGRKPRSDTIR